MAATRKEPTWHPLELLNSCRFSIAIKKQKAKIRVAGLVGNNV
jgi:hypothetical protein